MNTNKFKSMSYIEKTHAQFPSLHIDLSDSKQCGRTSGEQVSVQKSDFLWHPNNVTGLVAHGALAANGSGYIAFLLDPTRRQSEQSSS